MLWVAEGRGLLVNYMSWICLTHWLQQLVRMPCLGAMVVPGVAS